MAIAFDASTNGGYSSSVSSKTFSHTCSGSDRILFVGFYHGTTDTVTGVTYAGVSMTLVGKAQVPNGKQWTYMYYLVNPATGANNVVMSASGSGDTGIGAISYTGVSQTTIDASTTNTGVTPATFVTTLTTIAQNCWTVGFWRNADDDGNLLTISPGVFRQNAVVGYYSMGDSNGTLSAGSNSLTVTNDSPYGDIACIMASFAPVAASTTNSNFFQFF